MDNREKNLKKIDEIEELSDDELDYVTGGALPLGKGYIKVESDGSRTLKHMDGRETNYSSIPF